MNLRPTLILSALALAFAVPAFAKIERTVDKSFVVKGGGTVQLETSGGSITVVPGPDGEVKVTARERIKADSDEEADKLLKDLDLRFEQTGNDVRASAKYERGSLGFRFSSTPVQVDFIATVPASYVSDVRTSGGNITIGNLNGAVTAKTSGGSIKLGKIGGRVDARTSGGNVNLEEARDEVKLGTSGGSIVVGRVRGPADLSTSGGNITIESVEQTVTAHTSGGNIHAGLVGPLKGNCSLSTSGGNVRLTVDKAAAFHLDAGTSGGSVSAEGLTITLSNTSRNRSKLSGDVNGGGPEMKLRSSGGNINVQVRG